MKREWTDDMGEISGFGGTYEEACRLMVLAGCDWLDQHPGANPGFREYPNITGLLDEQNQDAKDMTQHMIKVAEDYGNSVGEGGVTGAMIHYTVKHAFVAHKEGWEQYQEWMRNRPQKEENDDGE